MSRKLYCDGCHKVIQENLNKREFTCKECEYGTDYHKTCLTEIYGESYCSTHVVRAKNDQMIREYVNKMWEDVGFVGTIDKENGNIRSAIGPLEMVIETEYDRDNDNLQFLMLKVNGLAEKTRIFKTSLHTHEEVVKQLKSAIIRSLRSTKSAITTQQKQLAQKTAKIDEIVNGILESLNGVLCDSSDLELERKKQCNDV